SAARPRDPALVVEWLPEQEGGGEGLRRRGAGLRRHPHERRLQPLLAEVLVDHLSVGPADRRERTLPVGSEGAAEHEATPQLEGAGAAEEGVAHHPREGTPLLDEPPVRLALRG